MALSAVLCCAVLCCAAVLWWLGCQDILVGLLRLRQVSGRIQHERQTELRGRWV